MVQNSINLLNWLSHQDVNWDINKFAAVMKYINGRTNFRKPFCMETAQSLYCNCTMVESNHKLNKKFKAFSRAKLNLYKYHVKVIRYQLMGISPPTHLPKPCPFHPPRKKGQVPKTKSTVQQSNLYPESLLDISQVWTAYNLLDFKFCGQIWFRSYQLSRS